jgi:hypothetical protein
MAHLAKGADPCPIAPAGAAVPGTRPPGRMNPRPRWPVEARCRRLLAITALTASLCHFALANTLNVNPVGRSGAYPTIGAAVQQAAADYAQGAIDTIYVAPGTYREGVAIGTPLSLVGASWGRSVIDATGLSNGIYIDGMDHPGLSQVVVTGFTIQNANFEGVLVTNASFVTLWGNEVTHNDRLLNPQGCPGLPPFQTNEAEDCGQGIHLMGVDHSVVANNLLANNAGGFLLSDETGATHHNLITANLVRNNPPDCGITLASHPPYPPITEPPGVFSNTIAHNQVSHNGYEASGGAGVGIFAPGPGNKAYGNAVIDNEIKDNGHPGVALHNHAAPPGAAAVNLNDNLIADNRIAGNGTDASDAKTPGPTGINVFGVAPITGTVISGNVITEEAEDVVVNTPAPLNVHLNALLGGGVGVNNLGQGTIDAAENWWGSAGGPGRDGATTVSGPGVTFTPWLPYPQFP